MFNRIKMFFNKNKFESESKEVIDFVFVNEVEESKADKFRRELNENLDVSKFLDFIYKKIEYYTHIKHENFFIDLFDGYWVDKYIHIDKPSSHELNEIITHLRKEGFYISQAIKMYNIYQQPIFAHKIEW